MKELSPIVFGDSPPGMVCRDRMAAYVVITDADGNVAAIRTSVRGRDKFWLPGGGMHAGESPQQTIAREVREELGRQVTLERRIGQALQCFYAGDEDLWYKMTAHFFAARLHDDTGGRGEYELQWVDPARCDTDFFHECHVWATRQQPPEKPANFHEPTS